METKLTKEELIEKSKIPSKNAMKMHPFYKGKLQVMPRCSVRDFQDFGIWYSPGVAAPCNDIYQNPETVYKHTSKWNYVAVVSDGTRVLGLGNIGPEAGLPVMEGKALLFKYLGGVDAFPLCVGPNMDAEQIIQLVKWIQPTFGGINLEDIQKPKCFKVLDALRKDPDIHIPVWHDDQQGTACVTVAGMINALKVVGKKRKDVKIVFNGVGASNFAIQRLLGTAGFNTKSALYVDSRGILYKEREDLLSPDNYKYEIAQRSNREQIQGDCGTALEGADVLISLSRSGPGVIQKEWISKMANDAVVFTCANPVPEIFPWDSKEAGARIVATGRSDFPNQVNNSVGFPGIFRGTLDVRATTITDEMCIAAAEELAKFAAHKGISENYIIPTMEDMQVFIDEAVAVGQKAIEQNVARIRLSADEARDIATKLITDSHDQTKLLMKEGFIPEYPNYL
ncbi:NADP-dependent malic enzyme [Candidatus Lokiarchaeum ossiferum]|uniref:NADP-dependent malic enzyme n=1 Tax=Candidatus Lokiarchaeum ossiferum TaxID=2951803 RepID=UPI00352CD94F